MRRSVPLDRAARESILEPAAETEIYDEVDVLVVGGGPAGVGAALSAARAGMRTLVVERYGCLGGIWTAGLLNPYFDAGDKGGIAEELIASLSRHGGDDSVQVWREWEERRHDSSNALFAATAHLINPEAMKFVLDSMFSDAEVKSLLYTYAVAAITEGSELRGIIVENKSGRSAILANVIIDSTGDGDVAYHAGCQYELGRQGDGMWQPMTLEFKVAGMTYRMSRETQLYETLMRYNSAEALAQIPFTHPAPVPIAGEPNTAAVQWTHMHMMDATNADHLTQAVIEGRRQVQVGMELMRNAEEALGKVRLVETAMQVGVRESRRILGEYHLEENDLLAGREFSDSICRVKFNMDIHSPDGPGQTGRPVRTYGLPYRCLVPLDIDQLLVAGRCISGSHEAHASYRVTGNCVAMGEAAGLAAARAIRTGIRPRDLDGRLVREDVRKNGGNV